MLCRPFSTRPRPRRRRLDGECKGRGGRERAASWLCELPCEREAYISKLIGQSQAQGDVLMSPSSELKLLYSSMDVFGMRAPGTLHGLRTTRHGGERRLKPMCCVIRAPINA